MQPQPPMMPRPQPPMMPRSQPPMMPQQRKMNRQSGGMSGVVIFLIVIIVVLLGYLAYTKMSTSDTAEPTVETVDSILGIPATPDAPESQNDSGYVFSTDIDDTDMVLTSNLGGDVNTTYTQSRTVNGRKLCILGTCTQDECEPQETVEVLRFTEDSLSGDGEDSLSYDNGFQIDWKTGNTDLDCATLLS